MIIEDRLNDSKLYLQSLLGVTLNEFSFSKEDDIDEDTGFDKDIIFWNFILDNSEECYIDVDVLLGGSKYVVNISSNLEEYLANVKGLDISTIKDDIIKWLFVGYNIKYLKGNKYLQDML